MIVVIDIVLCYISHYYIMIDISLSCYHVTHCKNSKGGRGNFAHANSAHSKFEQLMPANKQANSSSKVLNKLLHYIAILNC